MIIYFVSLHNIHLNLCKQAEISQRILCSQKTGVKCAHVRYLMYKYALIFQAKMNVVPECE